MSELKSEEKNLVILGYIKGSCERTKKKYKKMAKKDIQESSNEMRKLRGWNQQNSRLKESVSEGTGEKSRLPRHSVMFIGSANPQASRLFLNRSNEILLF